MKKTFHPLFVVILMVSFSLHAQVNYRINESTYQKVSLSFAFEDLKSIDVNTDEGYFSRIFIKGCGNSRNIGNPELPVSVNLLEIPICEDYVLNIYGNDYVIYDAETLGINYPVYPAQPPRSKSHDGPVAFIQNKNIYQTDDFYALPLAQFEKVGFMRNVNLGQLYVNPVQYNPVTHQVKIYHSVDVEILFKQTDLVKTQTLKELHGSPLFRPSNIINSTRSDNLVRSGKAEFSNVPIKYLIVAHSMFRGALDEFIAWKKRKGFLVEIGYTDDENVGTTTTSIAAFIKSHYVEATQDNPAPTYVLLVGDVQQIPAFIMPPLDYGDLPHATDLYYFTWEGGNIPCCYYGRFSAQNLQQLTPQIEKTLQYEQYTMPNSDYLNKISLVAGFDKDFAAKYGNGLLNYITQNYANKKNGYSTVYAHFHPCTSEAELIRFEIGEGVGIAGYTAHCNEMGWAGPDFYTYHVPAMNNLNKYGLMIGNCCLSNKFDYNECFGEALLRVEGKGAVGYIGGSNYTYWDEDYYWGIGFRSSIFEFPTYNPNFLGAYDRLFHTHGEIYDKWMTTFGAMSIAGNEAVQSSASELKRYYWEIYHLMGDPSVMTYLTKPAQMIVGIHDEILAGEKSLNAKVAPYSYCALTDKKGKLLSAGFANAEGNITLHFEPVDVSEEYEFAAWAQNHVQYFRTIKCVNTKKSHLVIYPNPAHTTIMVITKNPIFAYEIIDLTGRVVTIKTNINDNITPINVSSLANGIYFIKIIDNEQKTVVRKFVKQ
jgi:hypothetical protein